MRILHALLSFLIATAVSASPAVELRDGFFFIDGKRFFVKGIGYAKARPGEEEHAAKFEPELLRADIARILSGGYNTIRVWNAFTKEELDVLAAYDIKIIMGVNIWSTRPDANYSDPAFIDYCKRQTAEVLSYSKNFSNIIAYLLMNEPQPATVARSGYANTLKLWSELRDMVRAAHPGRAVGVSNYSTSTYIDQSVYDFSAYNIYPDDVRVGWLHGFRDFTHYLWSLKPQSGPLVITEYGVSASPSPHGDKGGRTLQQQAEEDVALYQALVDGGASGSCIFMYADVWSKNGSPAVHDDHPEEWWGLVGYENLQDRRGTERPAWQAVKRFQSAIVTQPLAPEIYSNRVPVEVFADKSVRRVDVQLDGKSVFSQAIRDGYLADTICFGFEGVKDANLIFNFYDAESRLIKSENKSILIAARPLRLPVVDFKPLNTDFWQTRKLKVAFEVLQSPDFLADETLRYSFGAHYHWEGGTKQETALPRQERFSFTNEWSLADHVDMFSVGAAFNARHGSFSTRIVRQQSFSRTHVPPQP